MSQSMKRRFPSITSIDVGSDGNTAFLRAARNGQLDKVLEHLKSNIDINTSNANGLNALHLASKDGHVDIVKELLKRGAIVDAATKKGNTALHIASLAGQEEVVKLLVQHGASVNVQSQNGFTPLYMAAQENHDNVVKYLLGNGANQSLSTEDGFTPLAVAMQQGHDKVVAVLLENDTRGKVRLPALHIAAKKDDVKAAKLLLENEHNPDVTSKSGFTPLHIASHYGNQQIANLLIQKGADVNYAAKHNITPLHVAAKWGKTNMVALLLEKGANKEAKTRDGLTPLHCAARSGHEQVVDMLLEKGAPFSAKTKNGLAPLHMAAQGDHVDAARILLYHRAPVDEVTVDYLTALHVAAHCGHVRVAKLLLDKNADANARALNGFTPLHIACKKNRIKVVELLLKHGASIGATTESGLTPLHVASFMGCMNIVIYLLQHDANPDAPTVRGETPLHLAARANQTDIIRILLRNGAQVDARAREQQTPLHIASRLGNVDIVMLLLQHGAKVDNATKDMYTALHIAAKEGQDEVAGVLIDNGASINATTKKGFTPLHLASKYGQLKVAKLLLQKEAPVDAQGKNGVTPLHVAAHYDHQNVALLLLDKGASPHATAKNGHTPLHIAARKNQMDIANTLLEYGAQPNSESKAGFTPLHLSAQEGHTEMSSLLLEHAADPNHQAKNGLVPLHLCAQEDKVAVAEILVKNGADIDAATKAGYTPLHTACHYGQTNMVRFLLRNGASVTSTTSLGYTPLHQAAQQGHANIVNVLLEHKADPNAETTNGQTPLNIAQKLGYITVIETLKVVTTVTNITTTTAMTIEEKYRVQAPELMHETFMSDSEEEGGEDTVLGDQTYRYLTADEMKSLGDDSLPIDVTRDERIDSNRMVTSVDSNMLPPQHIEDSISPEHVSRNYVEYIKKYSPDNVDISTHPINIGFLVSFLVDARGGAMRGCRHSGVKVIVPPRCAPSPTRITCRYVRPQRTPHPPPLMEGEALASRILELGPVGAKFLGPVIIEVPHFAALRGKEREIVILRSDNGESWKEHTVEASEDILNEVLHDSFEAEDLNEMEDLSSGRITRIVTQDFPQYFAVVSRIRQEVHAIGPEGGMVSSTVVPQVQAIFPEGALTKKIKVGLQAQPIDPELTAKLLGHGVAVSPVVTVEPRRRKFHKAIRLNMPAPTAHSQGMINQYSGSAPTLRLLCSITGGTTRAQWEDVTGSTPLTFVNDVVSFTTTVSARFWLMDCRNIGDATKMATELYKEAIHVPFMAKFVVFAKRIEPLEARLRVFCMTDDKEDKTLEHQEHFTEVAKSRDVEVLEGKPQYIEFAGNLVPVTKSGEQLSFSFRAFRENRLPFSVRVKDQHAEAVGRCLFMKEAKVLKGEPPQQPICILNIVLPDDIVTDTISLSDSESSKRHMFLSEFRDYYRPDTRLADMSNLLGDDWVELAHQLGLTSSEINVIKSEYPESVAKQAQSMLRMWLSQSGNMAQTNALENALRRIGREDIIPQCLNVEQPSHAISRIKEEEIGYRLRKSGADKEDETRSPEKKNLIEHYDKYSAEEKIVEKSESEEEEDNFDKSVTERRERIEKRLSAERAIPASSQRREIVQEISSIRQQNIVEDKIAEVKQKVSEPATTRIITETIEIKTTTPSDSKVSEVAKMTTVETHKVVEQSPKPGEDAKLLEEVSQRIGKARIEPRLNGNEDPKSPKFSKTPPPSPADFLIKEQAATIQEWDASKKPAAIAEETAPLASTAANQGKTTTTHLASKGEFSVKPIFDQTDAFIQHESRAEPYHPLTEQHYKISKETVVSIPPEKKTRKGFFGTLKTFVSKSSDLSDSDSEKSPKKEKKKKKAKKEKTVDVPPDVPVRPPRKPKLPTPTEDRKYADIPFVEAEFDSADTNGFTVDAVVDTAKIPSKTITTPDETAPEKITNVEKDANVAKPKTPKTKKMKTIVLEETITKTFAPAAVEEEEFTVIIDPTKTESPKKSKETFTLNIDESIDKIEKEILEKSPILSQEKIVKPVAHFDTPPTREPQHYDDVVVSQYPDNLVSIPERFKFDDESVKKVTHNLIENEKAFAAWIDDQPPTEDTAKGDNSTLKRKKKLFGIFRKSTSKDNEASDDDSSKTDSLSKHTRGKSREKSAERVLGLFGKKPKKSGTRHKPPLSEEVVEIMNQTDAFLATEKDKYEDCKLINKTIKPHEHVKVVPKQTSMPETKKAVTLEKQRVADELTRRTTDSFLKTEVANYHDVLPVYAIKLSDEERQVLAEYENDIDRCPLNETGADTSGLIKEPADQIDEDIVKIIATDTFLINEIEKYHDVRPRIIQPVMIEMDDGIEKKKDAKGAFGIFKKANKDESKKGTKQKKVTPASHEITKTNLEAKELLHESVETSKIKSKTETLSPTKTSMPVEVISNLKNTEKFLEVEVATYHDVRPLFKTTVYIPDTSRKQAVSMETSLDFLKQEIEYYHDVRPVVHEKLAEEVDANKKESKGIFGIFKKKNEKPDDKRERKTKSKPKQALSEEVVKNMEDTRKFLNLEVEHFHDARPRVEARNVIVEEEHKQKESFGLFGMFKKKPEGDKKHSKMEHAKEITLSAEAVKNMQSSSTFLREEVIRFHDVRPIVLPKEAVSRQTTATKDKLKLSGQVVYNMNICDSFLKQEVDNYHDVKPVVKIIVEEPAAQKSVMNESEAQKGSPKKKDSKGIFKIFKKQTKSEEKEMYHEQVLKQMNASNDFLKEEIARFHDVRPLVRQENIHFQCTATKDILKAMKDANEFLKQEVDHYHDVKPVVKTTLEEPAAQKYVTNELEAQNYSHKKKDPAGIFKIFKKQTKSEEKESYHDQVLKQMNATNDFLKEEVARFHDVRLIVQQEKFHFQCITPEDTLKAMRDAQEFLKQEVEVYHDVRPLKKIEAEEAKVQKTEAKKTESPKKKESRGIFKIFKKHAKSEERESYQQQNAKDIQASLDFLKREVDIFHDVRPIVKQIPAEEHIDSQYSIPEEVVKTMESTRHFLREEISRYHDVQPIKKSILHPRQDTNVVILPAATILGLDSSDEFLKKEVDVYYDERPAVEKKIDDEIEVKKKESKGLFGIFKKKSEDKPKAKEKPILSADVMRNMEDSLNFLNLEVQHYHDVRLHTLPQKVHVEKEIKTRESSGLFSMFKRRSKSRERDAVQVHQELLKTMDDTARFLQKEINLYHDVRTIKKIIPMEHSMEKEHVMKQQKPLPPPRKLKKELDAIQLRDDTAAFLKTEIGHFYDVRPIVPLEIEPKVIKESEHRGLFSIFKGKSKDKDDGAKRSSEESIRNMKTTSEFLNNEVNRYNDYRPIVKKIFSGVETNLAEELQDSASFLNQGVDKYHDVHPDAKNVKMEKQESNLKQVQQVPNNAQLMADTNEFLKQEISKYHDVKFVIHPKKIVSDSQDEQVEKKENKGLLGMFKKKVKNEDKAKALSEEVAMAMENTRSFLAQEVSNYYDAALTKKATAVDVVHELETVEPKDKKESKGILGIFKKKKKDHTSPKREPAKMSEEVLRNIIDSNEFLKTEVVKFHDVMPPAVVLVDGKPAERIPETTNFLNTELEKYEDSALKVKKQQVDKNLPQLSEEALFHMITTSNFLREEVSKYHDVRPHVTLEILGGPDHAEKPSKGGKLFALFGKKKSKDKEQSVEKEIDKTSKVGKENKKQVKEKQPAHQHTKPKSQTYEEQEAAKIIIDSENFLQEEISRYHDVRSKTEDKGGSGGLFEDIAKTTLPEKQQKPDIIDAAEFRETTVDDGLVSRKIHVITQEAVPKGDKTVTVTKEIYVVDPRVMEDVVGLDDEIKIKIAQAQAEARALDRNPTKPFVRETFTVETKIIDRIIPLSVDKEVFTETEVDYATQKSIIPATDPKALTADFIRNEISLYHDVRSIVKADDIEKSKSEDQKLSSKPAGNEEKPKRERKKSGSPFRIFEKKQRSDEENVNKENEEHKPDKKSKRDKKRSGGFLSMFSKSSESDDKSEPMEIIGAPKPYSPEAVHILRETSNFLNTELTNYEDAKPVIITDLDEDFEGDHLKSGLFSIFSKKDRRESPKISKRMFKKNKREKSEERKDLTEKTYKKLEDLDEAIDRKIKDFRDDKSAATFYVDVDTKLKKVAFIEKEGQTGETSSKPEKSDDGSRTKTLESSPKKGKGFFNKLGKFGEKITGKVEHTKEFDEIKALEEQSSKVVNDIIDEAEKKADQIKQETPVRTSVILNDLVISHFAEDVIQSFDAKMENANDTTKELEDHLFNEKEGFLQTVDDKYKETIKLSEEIAKRSKHKGSGEFLDDARRAIERETEESGLQVLNADEEDIEKTKQSVGDESKTQQGKTESGVLDATKAGFLSKLGDKISKKSTKTSQQVETNLEKSKSKVADDIKAATECFEKEKTDLEHELKRELDKVEEKLLKLGAAAQEVKTDVEDNQEKMKEKVKKKSMGFFGHIGQKIAPKLPKESANLDEAIKNQTDRCKDVLQNNAEGISKDSKEIVEDIKNDVATLENFIETKLQDIKDNVEINVTTFPVVDDAKQSISENISQAVSQIGNQGSKSMEASRKTVKLISEEVDDSRQHLKHDLEKVASHVQANTDELNKEIGKAEEKLFELGTTLPAAGEEHKASASEKTKDKNKKKSTSFFSHLSEKIVSKTSKKPEVERGIKTRVECAGVVVKDVKEQEGQEIKSVVEDIKEDISKLETSLDTQLRDIRNEVETLDPSQGVEGKKQTLNEGLKVINKTAGETTESFEQELINAGEIAEKIKMQTIDAAKKEHDKAKQQLIQLEGAAQTFATDVKDSLTRKTEKTKEKIKKKSVLEQLGEKLASKSSKKLQDVDPKDVKSDVIEDEIETAKKMTQKLESTLDHEAKVVEEASERLEFLPSQGNNTKKSVEGQLGRVEEELREDNNNVELQSTEAKKKSGGFFSSIGKKISGKSKDAVADAEQTLSGAGVTSASSVESLEKRTNRIKEGIQAGMQTKVPVKEGALDDLREPLAEGRKFDREFVARDTKGQIKQKTAQFLEAETGVLDLGQITRTVSDYGGKIKESEMNRGNISEANIDLSNLPDDEPQIPAYISSPTLARRTVSQKLTKDDRPEIREVKNIASVTLTEEISYIVTEPEDINREKIRKPLFHIESEEDDAMKRTNVKETVVENLVADLAKSLDEATRPVPTARVVKEEKKLDEHVKEAEADVGLIEQKLRDLDDALNSLEENELTRDESRIEKKLRRVERKFERMASQALEKDETRKMTSPDTEEKRESQFQTLVSQMSVEEVSDFQKEYGQLWDENTFSKSDDWESKTPESQADALELPKGDADAEHATVVQPTTSQAETEETHDKSEKLQEKKVADQHQLSHEMRELLKEMERGSKQ